jgi:hypothetical protein
MFPSQCQHNIAMLVNIVHKYQIHVINYSERYCPAIWRSDTRINRSTLMNWSLVTHAPKLEWPDNTFKHLLENNKSVPGAGSHHQHGEVHEERAQPAGHRDGEDQAAQHTQSTNQP